MEETTAVVNVAPGKDEAVTNLLSEVMRVKEYADKRVIANGEDVKEATNDLSMIAKLKKTIEEKRKEYTEPLNSFLKVINDSFKMITEPLQMADRTTRDKVLAFNQEIERQRQEAEAIEQEKLELARREMELKGEHTVDLTPVEAPEATPDRVRTEMGMASKMENWKYEVVDFALLPDDYKVVDNVALNSVAKKHHDQKEIPGVRFYNEPTLRVTTR